MLEGKLPDNSHSLHLISPTPHYTLHTHTYPYLVCSPPAVSKGDPVDTAAQGEGVAAGITPVTPCLCPGEKEEVSVHYSELVKNYEQ